MIRRSFLSSWMLSIGALFSMKRSEAPLLDVTHLSSVCTESAADTGTCPFSATNYKTDTIDIDCGNIAIRNIGGTMCGRGTTIAIDGIEQTRVRRITLDITANDPIVVHVEYVASTSHHA